jgi:tRNA (adenine22-N1)-methyltransferase
MPNRTAPRGNQRLRAIASLVPPGSRVADIGTDHGRLPDMLLASGRAAHCVATELAGRAAPRLPRPHAGPDGATRLEFRSGFGLRVLRAGDRIEVVVLSGLGARAVTRILEDRPPGELGVSRLVIQPQSEPARVRRWLAENGYAIVDERMVRERDRFYVVLAAEPGPGGLPPVHPRLDREDLHEAGPCLVCSPDPVVRDYWRAVVRDQKQILLLGSRGAGRAAARRRLERARRVLAALPREAKGPVI